MKTGLEGVAEHVAADVSTAADNAVANGIIKAGEEAGTEGVVNVGAADGGVWDLPPIARGNAIEQLVGANLPRTFPTIDVFENGVATSIKSIDLTAASCQDADVLTSRVNGYIDRLASFQGGKLGEFNIQENMVNSRVLMLVIKPGGAAAEQQAALDTLQSEFGAMLKIMGIP